MRYKYRLEPPFSLSASIGQASNSKYLCLVLSTKPNYWNVGEWHTSRDNTFGESLRMCFYSDSKYINTGTNRDDLHRCRRSGNFEVDITVTDTNVNFIDSYCGDLSASHSFGKGPFYLYIFS